MKHKTLTYIVFTYILKISKSLQRTIISEHQPIHDLHSHSAPETVAIATSREYTQQIHIYQMTLNH